MPKVLGSIPKIPKERQRQRKEEERGREERREENCRGAAVKTTYLSLVTFQEREPIEC